MFEFNNEPHDIETRNHDRLHLYPTRTSGARNVSRHHIPELLNKFPQYLIDKIKTHSIYSFSHQIKCYSVDLYSYECNDINCYVCNHSREWQIAKAETVYYDCPVIIGYTCSLLSHSDECRRGWWLKVDHRDWVSGLEMYNNSEIWRSVMGDILLRIMWNLTGFIIIIDIVMAIQIRCYYVSTDVTFHCIDVNHCVLWKDN